MPGSRGHKDCKLNAEDAQAVIDHTSRNTPPLSRVEPARQDLCRSPFQDLSREIREEQRENAGELQSVGRESKVELRAPDINAEKLPENLKRYIQQQILLAGKEF